MCQPRRRLSRAFALDVHGSLRTALASRRGGVNSLFGRCNRDPEIIPLPNDVGVQKASLTSKPGDNIRR
jgi:hypothetical protein